MLTKSLMMFALAAMSIVLWQPDSASAVTYLEQNGVVVGEGEAFFARTDVVPQGDSWLVVPQENAGAGNFSNNRGSGFVQALPDQAGGGGGPNNAPFIDYQMTINTTGTYRLFLRWDGNNLVGGGGNADSIFAGIAELADGPGGTNADHYEFQHGADANFASTPWDGNGGFEVNSASGNPKVAATYDITTPGTYTLRVSQREDGAAVDAFAFQLDSLAAPAGFGPTPTPDNSEFKAIDAPVVADSFVQVGNASTNFGGNGNLLVKDSGNGGTTRKSYVKFDVSGVDLTQLADADLKFEVSVNNNGGSPLDPTPATYTINVFGLTDGLDGWDENAITFNNAPGNAGGNGVDGNAVLLGQLGVPALNPTLENDPIFVSFNNLLSDTPDAFLNFLAADSDGLVTFILTRDGGSNNLGFASRENNGLQGPTLTLFSAAVPEPTTALLGLMGMAGLAVRRRRAA